MRFRRTASAIVLAATIISAVADAAAPKRHAVRPAPAGAPAIPAPDPFRKEFVDPALIEPAVVNTVAAHCPAAPLTTPNAQGRRYLTGFDDDFRTLLAGAANEPVATQTILEAYRRCAERTITTIQRLPRYALADRNQDDDCFDCKIYFASLALQIPRLREVEGLTYLAPRTLGDQEPARAVALMRQAIADFSTVQRDFADQAREVVDARQALVDRRRNAAIRQANSSAATATIVGLAGAGLGMALGLGTQQSTQIARDSMLQQYNAINTQLATQMTQVQVQQAQITAATGKLFDLAPDGRWSDDGIRVTVPRLLTRENADGKDYSAATGALSQGLQLRMLVHVWIRLDDTHALSCTGASVGPRLILTNRHCVQDEKTGALFTPAQFFLRWEYHAVEGARAARKFYSYKVADIVTSDRSTPIARDHTNDWAFLVLDKPSDLGAMELVSPEELARHPDFRISVAGYSGDLNEGSEVTMDWGCRAHWNANGTIAHRCRTFHGASGSPIITVDGTFARLRIAGVNAATELGPELSGGPVSQADYAGALKMGTAGREMYATWQALKAQYAE